MREESRRYVPLSTTKMHILRRVTSCPISRAAADPHAQRHLLDRLFFLPRSPSRPHSSCRPTRHYTDVRHHRQDASRTIGEREGVAASLRCRRKQPDVVCVEGTTRMDRPLTRAVCRVQRESVRQNTRVVCGKSVWRVYKVGAVLIAAAATDDSATWCQINASSGQRRSGAGRQARRLKRWQHRGSRDYRQATRLSEPSGISNLFRRRTGACGASRSVRRSRLRTEGKRGLVSWRTSGIIGERQNSSPGQRAGAAESAPLFAGYEVASEWIP
jgi:hypothetical protein